MAALVKAIVARYGRIDVLVNNVAISDNKHIFDITEEEWDRVLSVTLKSQFLMGQQIGKQMAAQGGGRIVNVGSTSGFTGRSRAVAYSAAKGGVANLTRAMAAQLAPHKIRVNAIVPNKIGSPVGRDEFDPSRPVPNMAKRPGEPAEAAKAVLFLVTDNSSFVWGANLFVDGGVSAMDLSVIVDGTPTTSRQPARGGSGDVMIRAAHCGSTAAAAFSRKLGKLREPFDRNPERVTLR